MNPKNCKVKTSSKTMPKKKVKNNNSKSGSQANKDTSKFYVTKDGKTNEPQKKAEETKVVAEEPKKVERSNSFIFTRTLSKIYGKISGSKENLDKLKNDEKVQKPEATPFKFQRSLTLNSFQLKKSFRKTFPEPRLEKLSEEKICDNEKIRSPPLSPPVTSRRARSPTSHRQSMPPGSFDDVDYLKPPHHKLERSDSFLSLIRRKISFTDHPKSSSMSSDWATSLQNLQQIDNMVSYEDLSFVDYDKFNQYEQQIDKMLIRQQNKLFATSRTSSQPFETVNHSVVLRRPRKNLNHVNGDFNRNLDREKNVYRQSIDSSKLQILSSINSDSHRWSQEYNNNPIDWLSLEENAPQALNPIT